MFERLVITTIIANSVVMLWSVVDHRHEELLENLDLAFLWFFAAELFVRLAISQFAFFRNPWGCFDAAIIVLALLPVLGGGIAVLRLARLARAGHLLRHSTHLRLWRGIG